MVGVAAELALVPGDPGLWRLAAGEVDAVLAGLVGVRDRLDAVVLGLVDHQVRGNRPAQSGASSAGAWLSRLTSASRSGAARTAGWAATLGDAARDPATAGLAADARSGAAPVEQVVLALRALAGLPTDLGAGLRERAVAVMREHAAGFGPEAVRALGERLVAVVDPEAGDRRLAEQLERAERAAHALRSLTINAPVAGLVRGRFALPTAEAELVRTALEALAAPAHRTPEPDADAVGSDGPTRPADAESGGDGGGGDGGDGDGDGGVFGGPIPDPTDPPEVRTRPQRMADALVELARQALTHGELPVTGGHRPQVVITLDWETLRTRTGAATTPDGHTRPGAPLSPDTARRIACDAAVIPAVLGGTSQPLDIGHTTRVVPTGLRRALALRDGGCVFPGCTRPPSWCDAHHLQHWAENGPTTLTNLALLCGHHHRLTHRPGWDLRVNAAGHPEWRPPPWIAPPGTIWHNTGHPTREATGAAERQPGVP